MLNKSRSVSSCTLSKIEGEDNLFVKVRNSNSELSRTINLSVYDQDSSNQEKLNVFLDDTPLQEDTLAPESERIYRIDVSTVAKAVLFEISTNSGGSSSFSMKQSSKGPNLVELIIK